jgi:hypothetical protein
MSPMSTATGKCNRLVILSSLAFLAGCSSFNREWKAAPAATAPGDIQGKWQGHWRSDKDAHTGALKCVITKGDGELYCAHFVATYWKIFTFAYDAELRGAVDGDSVHLVGEQDLGALAGGIYRYDGSANNTDFHCSYASKYDYGKFILSRPAGETK